MHQYDEATDLRLTPQRRAVLAVLAEARDHPTAAEVLERVQRDQPGVGAATVYRTLARLVDTGQALELSLTEGAARYDANTTRHDHVVCDTCGRAVDVDFPLPEDLVAAVREASGFRLSTYSLQFRGTCDRCTQH